MKNKLSLLIRLAVAQLDLQIDRLTFLAWGPAHPGDLVKQCFALIKLWMVLPLHKDQTVAGKVLICHKPAAAIAVPADAQPFALADGVLHQPVMPAQCFPGI